jgi:hypothetical protein
MVMNEAQSQSAQPYEYQPPRPYVWKTDEFQLPETADKKTKQVNQVQPLTNMRMLNQTGSQPMSLYQQSASAMNYGYRCPRCGTQNIPQVTRKISTAGWIVFAVLLVMFFPLFWIGFLMKEDVKICPVCTLKVG